MTITHLPIAETDPHYSSFNYVPSDPNADYFDGEEPLESVEFELLDRFEYERMTRLTDKYLVDILGEDWEDTVGDRQFVVGLVSAAGEYKDLGAFVETVRFAQKFKRPSSKIYDEYSAYDHNSVFAVVIDVKAPQPFPIGSLRMIEPSNTEATKTFRDFVGSHETNPWLEDLQETFFNHGEEYDPAEAWERVVAGSGETFKLAESLDIPTLAVFEEYASNGAIDGASLVLYHTCLQFALSRGYKNLISIQDLRPLAILQSFGSPFDVFQHVSPKVNEGEYPGVPAYCVLDRGMERIRQNNKYIGKVFIDGETLDIDYVLPREYKTGKLSPLVGKLAIELPTVA